MIRILVTGGTFDKEYNEVDAVLAFRETHVPKMLELGRCRLDVEVQQLLLKDSLDLTDADRAGIVRAVRECAEETGLEAVHPAGGPHMVHVDVHPAGDHLHLDLRYLLVGPDADPAPPPGESQEVAWFTWDAAAALADDAGHAERNLMPAIFDAVGAYATVGEMMGALAEVFGRWEETAVI